MLHTLLNIYLCSAITVIAEYPILKYIYTHDPTAVHLAKTHDLNLSKNFGSIVFCALMPLLNTFMALQTLLVILFCVFSRK